MSRLTKSHFDFRFATLPRPPQRAGSELTPGIPPPTGNYIREFKIYDDDDYSMSFMSYKADEVS